MKTKIIQLLILINVVNKVEREGWKGTTKKS
jgi:hypothetical protein